MLSAMSRGDSKLSVPAAEPTMRANLLRLAKAYAAARGGASLASVSRSAHGDPPFFDRLLIGKGSFTVRKYDEVRAWFAENMPKGTAWPHQDEIQEKKRR